MRKLLFLSAASAASLMVAQPALAEPWVRSFVVESYEPAFYYGGTATADGPGSDCPQGNVPDLFINTDYVVPPGAPPGTRPKKSISQRGFDPRINTYANPFAAIDEGMQEVTGTIGVGFDLDNNPKTGFTSPEGVMGIDNNLYKSVGCTMSWRGLPGRPQLAEISNGQMRSGLYTFVIRVSGNQSPENDSDAVVELGYAPDPIQVSGTNGVLAGASYRIAKNERYSRLPVTIRNGVIETKGAQDIRMPDHAYCEAERGENYLRKGRLRLEMSPKDGTLKGLIGGYRDWVYLYVKDSYQAPCNAPSTRETLQFQNQIGLYYSLQRNADGMPDPETGRNMGISTAYRITAQHAHVVDTPEPVLVSDPSPPDIERRVQQARVLQKLTTDAILTKRLAAIPANAR